MLNGYGAGLFWHHILFCRSKTGRQVGMTLKTLLGTIDKQEKIMDLQKDVINDLFRLLSLHISAEELNGLDAVKKINLAAQIRAEIE
jgi:hypothetical protein